MGRHIRDLVIPSILGFHTKRLFIKADYPFKEYRLFSTSCGLETSGQRVTQKFLDAFAPATIKKIRRLKGIPPSKLERAYHRDLNKICHHPAKIIRLYYNYSRSKKYQSFTFLLRCFTALGHCFSPNSFWATADKQNIHKLKTFRELMFDLTFLKNRIRAVHVPRLIYGMAAMEYRCWQLLPTILDVLEDNLQFYRCPTLATIGICLSWMGIGDNHGNNQFGPRNNLTRDYSGLLDKICLEVTRKLVDHNETRDDSNQLGPFEASGLSFAMTMAGSYDLEYQEHRNSKKTNVISLLLREACKDVNISNLSHSGWVQFYLYQTLYCSDVEKPKSEEQIKKSIPLQIQKSLHLRWLEEILLKGQPQGSEQFQKEVEDCLERIEFPDALINCSAGREWDEQHCWFSGHFIKSRNLTIHYDYMQPLGPNRPKPSGWLSLQHRLMIHFGFHASFVHKCQWDKITNAQQNIQLLKLITRAPIVRKPEKSIPDITRFATDRFLYRKRRTFDQHREAEKSFRDRIIM